MAIDLFCGLGGWTDGLLAEGYQVIGFDIEQHVYGEHRYPAQLVLQDVRTLHGSQFRNADLIVASPPCQEYSYMAMPWTRAKKIAEEYRSGIRDVKKLTELFDACFRIQREACEAKGEHIPLIVENVRGAIPWVGRSRWNCGSFHLWGDVPALMPMTKAVKVPTMGAGWYPPEHPKHAPGLAFNTHAERHTKNPGFRFDGRGRSFQSESVDRYTKNSGGSWFNVAHNTTSGVGRNPDGRAFKVSDDGVKGFTPEGQPLGQNELGRKHWSTSPARKAASAMIARIPLPLARHIASVFKGD